MQKPSEHRVPAQPPNPSRPPVASLGDDAGDDATLAPQDAPVTQPPPVVGSASGHSLRASLLDPSDPLDTSAETFCGDDAPSQSSAPGSSAPGSSAPRSQLPSDVSEDEQLTLDSGVRSQGLSNGSNQSNQSHPSSHQGMPANSAFLPVSSEYYERGKELARGGMGRILLAQDRRLQRPVAIKELLSASASARRRFEREALITAKLQHPGIVNVYEAGCWPNGEQFYAMEKVNGRPLEDVIDDAPDLKHRLALLPHLIDVAEAMAYAHSQGVIHRDLKPANVLVGAFGETIVIDWGLAKVIGEPDEAAPDTKPLLDNAQNLTVAGSVMGTPAFMPPEQAIGEQVDARADVYAIGAMLYYLLSGQTPFQNQTSRQILISLLGNEIPAPLGALVPAAPPELLSVAARAMDPDRAKRYRDAGALAADLRSFQTGKMVASHQYTPLALVGRWLKRHKALVTVVLIASLALLALAVYSVHHIMEEQQNTQSALDVASRERNHALGLNNEMILARVRELLYQDPTWALAWLKRIEPQAAGWAQARAFTAQLAASNIAEHILRGHQGLVAHLVLHRNEQSLLSSASDGTLRRWRLSDLTAEVYTHPEGLQPGFAVSADAVFAATLTHRDHLAVIDFHHNTVKLITDPSGAPLKALPSLSFAPMNRRLAFATADGTIYLYDFDLAQLKVVTKVASAPQNLRFGADGLLTASVGSETLSIDPNTQTQRLVHRAASGAFATDTIQRNDGQWAVALYDDQPPDILRRDLITDTMEPVYDLLDLNDTATAAAFSPSGRWLAVSFVRFEDNGQPVAGLVVVNLNTYTPATESSLAPLALDLHSKGAPHTQLRFSEDEQFLLGVSAFGGEVWDLSRPPGHEQMMDLEGALTASFFAKSPRIITSHPDESIRIYRLDARSRPVWATPPLAPGGLGAGFSSAAVDVAQGVMFACDAEGRIYRWRPAQDGGGVAMHQVAQAPAGVSSLVVSADGQYVAALLRGQVLVWRATPDALEPVEIPELPTSDSLRFSPTGHTLAVLSADHTQAVAVRLAPHREPELAHLALLNQPPPEDFGYGGLGMSGVGKGGGGLGDGTIGRGGLGVVGHGAGQETSDSVPPFPPSQHDPPPLTTKSLPDPNATEIDIDDAQIAPIDLDPDGLAAQSAGEAPDTTAMDDVGVAQAQELPHQDKTPKKQKSVAKSDSATRRTQPKPTAAEEFNKGHDGTEPPPIAAPPSTMPTSAEASAPLPSDKGNDERERPTTQETAEETDSADPLDAPGTGRRTPKSIGGGGQTPKPQDPPPPSDGALTADSGLSVERSDLTSPARLTVAAAHPDLQRDPLRAQSDLLSFASGGQQLLTVSEDQHSLWLWDLGGDTPNPKPTVVSLGAETQIRSVLMSADGQTLFVSAGPGQLLRLSADAAGQWSAQPQGALPCDGLTALRLALSPDGTKLAAVMGLGHVRVWTLGDGTFQDVYTTPRNKPLGTLHFSPNGAELISTELPPEGHFSERVEGGHLHQWGLAAGTYRVWWPSRASTLALAWLPGAEVPTLLRVGDDGVAQVWRDTLPSDSAALRAYWRDLSPVTLDDQLRPATPMVTIQSKRE